jgi:hypothetical protein
VKRSALVIAGHRARTHRWLPGVLLALGLVAGAAVTGRVLASDPVGYGVAFWPFADSADRAEEQLMALVSASARTPSGDLAAVPIAVRRERVEVLLSEVRSPTSPDGTVFMRLRLHLPASTGNAFGVEPVRCREAIVRGRSGLDVSSRRVDCQE